ncbi:MAG: LysR family transcriptional regulator [Nitriliruptor sp.]|nr:MAG: LysR family transcriptional regulator [Nitriliruptor sp.]
MGLELTWRVGDVVAGRVVVDVVHPFERDLPDVADRRGEAFDLPGDRRHVRDDRGAEFAQRIEVRQLAVVRSNDLVVRETRQLHLAPSTVSHRLRELEASLGFALFERLPRSVQLTDLGRAYIPVVRSVFDELTMATVGMFGTPGGGRVTVRTPVSYGVRFLAPRLATFTADHDVRVWVVSAIWGGETPDIEVDLEVDFSDAAWRRHRRTCRGYVSSATRICGNGLIAMIFACR